MRRTSIICDFAAELVEYKGDKAKAEALRKEAVELGKRVLELYIPARESGNAVCRTAAITKFITATISVRL